MTEPNIPFVTEHRDVYRCPWCGKPYLRQHDVKYHIDMKCHLNPANIHPCFWCKHLEKKDADVSFQGIGCFGEYHEEIRKVPSFYCKKHDQWLYTKLAERKNHPCVNNGDHFLMPYECEDFCSYDVHNNPVPWSLEAFAGKPWYQKQQERNKK